MMEFEAGLRLFFVGYLSSFLIWVKIDDHFSIINSPYCLTLLVICKKCKGMLQQFYSKYFRWCYLKYKSKYQKRFLLQKSTLIWNLLNVEIEFKMNLNLRLFLWQYCCIYQETFFKRFSCLWHWSKAP